VIFSQFSALKTTSQEQTLERQLDQIQGYINWNQRVLKLSIDEVLRNMLLKDLKRLEMEKHSLTTKIRDT
jgi:hypothetical protein